MPRDRVVRNYPDVGRSAGRIASSSIGLPSNASSIEINDAGGHNN